MVRDTVTTDRKEAASAQGAHYSLAIRGKAMMRDERVIQDEPVIPEP